VVDEGGEEERGKKSEVDGEERKGGNQMMDGVKGG